MRQATVSELWADGELSDDALAVLNRGYRGYSVGARTHEGRDIDTTGIYRSMGHAASLMAQLAMSGAYATVVLLGWRMTDLLGQTAPDTLQSWTQKGGLV